MENLMKEKTKGADSVHWRAFRFAIGICLIPFLLIPIPLPRYLDGVIGGVAFGFVCFASSPSVTIFKLTFSGAFVGAIYLGFSLGLSPVLFDFLQRYFNL